MYNTKLNRMRCDGCGRFMKYQEKGTSICTIPASDITFEEIVDYCKACTKKYGAPLPKQSVNLNVCAYRF